MLLASQFQGFCRDRHSEAADFIASATQPTALRPVMKERLVAGRQLHSGNAQPGSIGSDFGRFFASKFWDEVDKLDASYNSRRAELERLNKWRNAIAHQDFGEVGSQGLRLAQVRRWRANCNVLATAFDRVLGRRLRALVGSTPGDTVRS